MVSFKQLVIIIMFLITSICNSQNKAEIIIQGNVVDQISLKPIEFGTVVLINKITKETIKGTVTNENGDFKLTTNEQDFTIQISFIGYLTVTLNEFKIEGGKAYLPRIKMEEDMSKLEEVIIQAEQSKLVNGFGKQILYVGSDIGSAGNSSLSILENFPSVIVGLQGDISVRGNNNIVIYINGKPTSKKGRSLKHLPAELVEKVELITNPSAEYGADGVAGILNIILKKDKNKGFNLTANGNFQGLFNPLNLKYGASLNTNYNLEKINIFFNGGYTSSDYENSETNFQKCITGDCDILNYKYVQFEDGLQKSYDMNFGLLWNVSPISTVEVEGSYLKWDIVKDGIEINDFLFSTNDSENYELRNFSTSTKEAYELMATYTTLLNSKDKFLLQFRHISDTWDRTFLNNLDTVVLTNTPIENTLFTDASVDRDTDYLLDGTVTLNRSYGTLISGFATQLSFNDLNQDIHYASSEILPTNDFEASSLKNSLFSQLKNEKENLKWQFGLRIERLDQNFKQRVNDISVKRDFLNIFPSGILEYGITDDSKVSLSYSNRINYTRLTQLNPFNYFTSPLNLRKGNTNLEPSKSNNIEATYSYTKNKTKWTNTLFANFSQNLIRNIISTTTDGITTQEPFNDGNSISTGYETSFTANPFKWLKLIHQGTFYYRQFSTENAQFNNQFSGNLRFFQELKFKKDLKIQLKESYRTPTINPQRRELDEFYMDIAVQKKLNNRWAINASFTDIFRTKRIAYTNRTDNYIIDENLRFQFQRISISINYKLKD